MAYPTYRKLSSLLLLTVACFAFAVVSQGINHLFMLGVPLYQPPFGALGNILLAIMIGASLGLLLGWFETGAVSVIWASLLGSLFMAVATLLTGNNADTTLTQKITAVIIIFVPVAAAVAPVLILFRWLISREVLAYRDTQKGRPSSAFQRFAFLAAALLICAALGLTSLQPILGRSVTPQMHQLIQQGIQSKSIDELPTPLRPPDVKMFTSRANGPYTLQWDRDEHNQFAIPRPAGNIAEQSTVIARFDNGYILACMFPGKASQPTCRDF